MLREVSRVRQVPGDRFRRVFSDEALEVLVWYDPSPTIYGFQICYDPHGVPRALTWTPEHGFRHAEIDDGEDSVLSNRTPMLQPGGGYDAALVGKAFAASADGLPGPEREFIEGKLPEAER